MLKKCFLLSIIGLVILFSSGNSIKKTAFNNGILIENVTIINPDSSDIEIFKGHIVIQNQIIVYVGKKKPDVSKDVQKIDGNGKFIIPGLIDSHVHLANIAGFNGKFKRKYPELATSYYQQMPKSYLYFGFTTLIDPNNHSPKILESILKEEIRPEILTCGEQLEVMNGFMMYESKPEDRFKEYPNFIHDSYNKNAKLPDNISPDQHTPKAAVQRVSKQQNGKCIKLAFENGFGGTEEVTWEMPTKEIVRDIVREARKEKMPVLLHANSFESQQFAYDTNVDIIAHGMWHWGLLKDYLNVRELPETHKTLLRKIAKKQIGYQPTFRVIAGQRDVFDDEFINDENLSHIYPKEFLDWLKTDEGHWQQNNIKKYAKGFFDGKSNSEIAAFMQLIVDKISISTNFLAKNDANLLFGTDTPASNAHTNPPGYNGYLEMQEWFKAEISLKQILTAATINNAKAFNLDKTHGSIEKGKVANLLLLDKDPLKDISAYNSIDLVIIKGKIFGRNRFSANAK